MANPRSVEQLDLLQRISSTLVDAARASEKKAKTGADAAFLQEVRTGWQFIDRRLDYMRQDSEWRHYHCPAEFLAVLGDLGKILRAEAVTEACLELWATEGRGGSLEDAINRNDFSQCMPHLRHLCMIYVCVVNISSGSKPKKKLLNDNPALIDVALRPAEKKQLVNNLEQCRHITFDPAGWHPWGSYTSLVRMDACKLYDAVSALPPVCESCAEDGSSHSDSSAFAWASSVGLRLDGTWNSCHNSTATYSTATYSAAPFEVFIRCNESVQECKITIDSQLEVKEDCVFTPDCDNVTDDEVLHLIQGKSNILGEDDTDYNVQYQKASPTLYSSWGSDQEPTREFRGISLDRLLPYNWLNYSERSVLSLTIARAVLNLLGTLWLPSGWGLQDFVVFPYDISKSRSSNLALASNHRSTNEIINLRRPFLITDRRRGKLISNPPAKDKQSTRQHRFPDILRLGIVLMEIDLGTQMQRINKHPVMTRHRTNPSNSATLRAARFLFEECKRRHHPGSPLLQAFDRCQDRLAFREYWSKDYDSTGFIDAIYAEIVHPLEHALLRDWRPFKAKHIQQSLEDVLNGEAENPMIDTTLELGPLHPRYVSLPQDGLNGGQKDSQPLTEYMNGENRDQSTLADTEDLDEAESQKA
ncbi:hypothetical protein AK830_g4706 [Neonectria ditissima]|uniref:DUF7580 domain-containing protein n=1 Tax=Neonectria ditissima TaxID=78410 RepID=A0A0P7BNA5_9HYPO|nr:hypothetical protein AK830_g4706 [Neonectria ditissima]